jgi:hypothetical protein
MPEEENFICDIVFTAIESFVPFLRSISSLVCANDTKYVESRNAIRIIFFMILYAYSVVSIGIKPVVLMK